MPATITRFTTAPAFQATNVSYIKDIMTSLGIATSAIVYETTTEAIYKITNGTGTYADTYLRFVAASFALSGYGTGAGWQVQVGTGFASNAITGAGTATSVMNVSTSTDTSFATFFTTVVSADGSYRQLMHFDATYGYKGGFAIVRPTNTTLTANNAPLTYIATSASGSSSQQALNYARSASDAQYGSNTALSNLAVSASLPSQYSLNVAKAGTYGVLPNVPILSGGWPIGYNSNLAFVSASFLPMDRVIVTAGSEEYMVVDRNTGLAVREF